MTKNFLLIAIACGILTACQTGNSRELLERAKAMENIKIAEPALIGKVIDFETKQPLQGVFVYGFYATTKGSVGGGSSIGEHIRSFETQTDVNGEFKLPAWDSGEKRYTEAPFGTNMPTIAFFKGGYGTDVRSYQSIRQYRPSTKTEEDWKGEKRAQIAADGTIDWRATPHALKRTTTELERHNALVNSGDAMMMVGSCGWEAYAGLILAQHNELKAWIKRVVPREHMDADGYGRDTYFHPDPLIRGYYNRSPVDKLIRSAREQGDRWRCTDPQKLLAN